MSRLDSNARNYKIHGDGYHFLTGIVPNNIQVLIGFQSPDLIAVSFDSAGELLGTAKMGLTSEIASDFELVASAARDWLVKMNGTVGPIGVKQFFLDDYVIGIKDLPEHYSDVVDNESAYDNDRRVLLLKDIDEWLRRGSFVLYWDEDYYFDEDGELESS